MKASIALKGALAALAMLALCSTAARAQRTAPASREAVRNYIVPQAGGFSEAPQLGRVQVAAVDVKVAIVEQVATTVMDISLKNPSARPLEAELIVPVPDGAVVRGFTYQGSAQEPTARVLPKDEARATYDRIVAKVRDPALLEFIGYNLIRSSVFPVPGGGEQKVRLTYEHILPADGDRIDYVLPRSENLQYAVPWTVSVSIKSKRPISTVYSPSHKLETTRRGPNFVTARMAEGARREPGPFRLSYLLEQDGLSATLLAYPDAKTDGGYFLLLAGLPAQVPEEQRHAIKREVTLVLDHSGSMGGEKLEQVREAALQILAGLNQGEAFNIIAYNDTVRPLFRDPVIVTPERIEEARRRLKALKSQGGTNIHEALTTALRQKLTDGMLPLVLFLTDGLPTTGETSEIAIRRVATHANPHKRRIFTFGVGVDVNTPLLEKIAVETRATPTFLLPNENVEAKIAQVFRRLSGPVLADTEFSFHVDAEVAYAGGFISEVMPGTLPDLFDGDQLVLLGRYERPLPVTFTISGNYLGKSRRFQFSFDLDKATVKNAFVMRLWASRRIAFLVDAIRDLGADAPLASVNGGTDPRIKELVDEIVRLSTEYGILTEYTAFLAREGTDLAKQDQVLLTANTNFLNRAMRTRSGLGSHNQATNFIYMRSQQDLNRRNGYYDENMDRVEIATVQQFNDSAFYRRGNRWVDSRLVTQEGPQPERVIEFGSPEFRELALRLAQENRQGSISLRGEILMLVDGHTVLVKNPDESEPVPAH